MSLEGNIFYIIATTIIITLMMKYTLHNIYKSKVQQNAI